MNPLTIFALSAAVGWWLITSMPRPGKVGNQQKLGSQQKVGTEQRVGTEQKSPHPQKRFSIDEGLARWLLAGLLIAAALSVKNPWLFPVVGPISVASSAAAYSHRQKRMKERQREQIAAELPVVIELLALATSAGESPASALARVANSSRGHVGSALNDAVIAISNGATLVQALEMVKGRLSHPQVDRSIDAVILGYERGTPLGDVLHAQALDVREQYRRSLIEFSARAEIAMMLPVVFLIMPVTIIFALFPSLQALTSQ